MTLTIRPGNPNDFSTDELQELHERISRAASVPVSVEPNPQRGYGVTLWEVMDIVSTVGGAAAAVEMALRGFAAVVKWMQERWRREKQNNPNRRIRPKCVTLYDGEGKILRTVLIDEPDGEPQDRS